MPGAPVDCQTREQQTNVRGSGPDGTPGILIPRHSGGTDKGRDLRRLPSDEK